jgi:hypothetical protein
MLAFIERFASTWPALLMLLMLMSLAGCGGLTTYPVDGKVVYDDGSPAKDLAGYTVSFEHEDGQHSASGVIDGEGSFKLSTENPDDGAIAGNYRVAITPPEPPVDAPIPPPKIRREYGDFASSGLTAEVKSEKTPIELKVERLK